MLAKALGFCFFAIIALLVLAALGLFAKMLMTFLALLLIVALIPVLVAAYAKLLLSRKEREDVNRGRGTVLKQIWEERQHREW